MRNKEQGRGSYASLLMPHCPGVICISPRKPIVRAHVLILPARLLDISLGAAL